MRSIPLRLSQTTGTWSSVIQTPLSLLLPVDLFWRFNPCQNCAKNAPIRAQLRPPVQHNSPDFLLHRNAKSPGKRGRPEWPSETYSPIEFARSPSLTVARANNHQSGNHSVRASRVEPTSFNYPRSPSSLSSSRAASGTPSPRSAPARTRSCLLQCPPRLEE